MKNHDDCEKLDLNNLKNDYFMAILNLVLRKPILFRALSWTYKIAYKIHNTNIFARFFYLVTFRGTTMNYLCIFYHPTGKWLDTGAILVMWAMMPPQCLVSWPKGRVS